MAEQNAAKARRVDAPGAPRALSATLCTADPRPHALAVTLFLLLAAGLRLVYAGRFPYDSDESQHMHVVWGWLTGQIPYRDFFDNHAPLFHLLCVPLLKLLGERPDVLLYARLAMFPLYAFMLLATYRIGAPFFGRQVAAWATVLLSVFPLFFLKSLEFRTDDLWAALWLAVFWALTSRRFHRGRWFVIGLLIGAMFGVSLKTTFLLVGFIAAALVAWALARRDRSAPPARQLARSAAAFAAGAALVPAALLLLLAANGAWDGMLYSLVRHNVGVQGHWLRHTRLLALPTAFACGWQARSTLRRYPSAAAAAPELITALATGFSLLVLWLTWPLVDSQDYVPLCPLLLLFGASVFLGAQRRPVPPDAPPASAAAPVYLWVPCAAALGLVALLLGVWPFWRFDSMRLQNQLLADVLRYTDRSDPIADLKGETIYRRRPMWYVMESVTKDRLRRGLIPDDLAQRIAASGTAVVALQHYTPATDDFIARNYLPVSRRLAVAGKTLATSPVRVAEAIDFDVTVPSTYTFVDDNDQVVAGTLDGAAFGRAQYLAAGPHRFEAAAPARRLTLLWAKAFDRGFKPAAAAAAVGGARP